MKPPRLSVARVMVVVAILAVNLAAVRALNRYDTDLAQGVALMSLALQFAAFWAIRRPGRARTFWAGFLALGAATMLTFVWCLAFPDSTMYLVWTVYTKYANLYINRLTHVWDFYNRTGMYPVLAITLATVWAVPQLLIACFGGLMVRSICTGGDVNQVGGRP